MPSVELIAQLTILIFAAIVLCAVGIEFFFHKNRIKLYAGVVAGGILGVLFIFTWIGFVDTIGFIGALIVILIIGGYYGLMFYSTKNKSVVLYDEEGEEIVKPQTCNTESILPGAMAILSLIAFVIVLIGLLLSFI